MLLKSINIIKEALNIKNNIIQKEKEMKDEKNRFKNNFNKWGNKREQPY